MVEADSRVNIDFLCLPGSLQEPEDRDTIIENLLESDKIVDDVINHKITYTNLAIAHSPEQISDLILKFSNGLKQMGMSGDHKKLAFFNPLSRKKQKTALEFNQDQNLETLRIFRYLKEEFRCIFFNKYSALQKAGISTS